MLIRWADELENAISKYDFQVEETESYLKLRFRFFQEPKNCILNIINITPEEVISRIVIHHDAVGEDLASLNLDETSLSDGDACSLLFIKNKEVNLFFITHNGFEKSLTKITKSRIVFIKSDIGFSSLSCDFVPISDYILHPNALTIQSDWEESFTTFLNGKVDFLSEISIPFFVLKDAKENQTAYFKLWEKEACRHIIFLTGSKVESEGGAARQLIIKSERKLTFSLDVATNTDSFPALQELAKWLILPKRDAKVRHQIFVGCLTREGGECENIWEFFNDAALHAIEAAQLNYDSLLDKEARESLKVMVEIRKAIFDVASQISKDAQEISSRAAADIAAVVALFIARVTLVAKGSIDIWSAKTIIAVAIFYIGYRAYSVLYVSKKFFRSTEAARTAWNKRIYCNLNTKDREELSEQPIERAKKILAKSEDAAGIAYALMLLALALALIL